MCEEGYQLDYEEDICVGRLANHRAGHQFDEVKNNYVFIE